MYKIIWFQNWFFIACILRLREQGHFWLLNILQLLNHLLEKFVVWKIELSCLDHWDKYNSIIFISTSLYNFIPIIWEEFDILSEKRLLIARTIFQWFFNKLGYLLKYTIYITYLFPYFHICYVTNNDSYYEMQLISFPN